MRDKLHLPLDAPFVERMLPAWMSAFCRGCVTYGAKPSSDPFHEVLPDHRESFRDSVGWEQRFP